VVAQAKALAVAQTAMPRAPHQAARPEAIRPQAFLDVVQQTDAHYRVNPSHLSLEITVKFNIP
jgi:hypothetical protein